VEAVSPQQGNFKAISNFVTDPGSSLCPQALKWLGA